MPTTHICERCGKNFKQKSHLDAHMKRKRPCKKDDALTKLVEAKVEERVNTRIMELLESGNERNEVVNERTSIPVKVVTRKKQQQEQVDNGVSPINILTELVRKNYSKLTHARNTYEVIASRMNIMDNQEDLITFIGQHLKPKEIEKKQNGEVFTPPKLIKQKFDKLTEIDPSVWTDPSKKFLDPANGIGNYPALAFHRLMDGLKDAIPDEYQRKKHILENMLYMCELNKKNVEVSKKLFDPKDEFKLNIHCGSFLELDTKEVWSVEKFDVIMGNPPYNDSSSNKGKGHNLWIMFVNKCLPLMRKDGFIVFVHPSIWRQIDNKILIEFKKLQLHYLEIHNVADGQSLFKCSTAYDWYVLQNRPKYTTTDILGDDRKSYTIDIDDWDFIPNSKFDLINDLISHNGESLDIKYYRSNYGADKKWVSRIKDDVFKYPVVYSIRKGGVISLRYSNTNQNGHFGRTKFIFSNGMGTYCDKDGEYGLTQWAYCIYDEPDMLDNIQKAFENKEFCELMSSLKFDSSKYNIKVMEKFKKDFWKEFV